MGSIKRETEIRRDPEPSPRHLRASAPPWFQPMASPPPCHGSHAPTRLQRCGWTTCFATCPSHVELHPPGDGESANDGGTEPSPCHLRASAPRWFLTAVTDSIDLEARRNTGCTFVGLPASHHRCDSVGLLGSLGVPHERLRSLKSATAVSIARRPPLQRNHTPTPFQCCSWTTCRAIRPLIPNRPVGVARGGCQTDGGASRSSGAERLSRGTRRRPCRGGARPARRRPRRRGGSRRGPRGRAPRRHRGASR